MTTTTKTTVISSNSPTLGLCFLGGESKRAATRVQFRVIGLAVQARIERVAQGIAHIVEGQRSGKDTEAGIKRQPRLLPHALLHILEHVAPGGNRRSDAKAEE